MLLLCTPLYPASRAAETPDSALTLAEYEGRYAYRDGLTLFMVTDGAQLIAIIDQSKYLLRPEGADRFLNPAGDSIPFVRDANGRIKAFKEYGQEFARQSSSVPAVARSLLEPRPRGPNGLQATYRYRPPTRTSDGIRVRDASAATLPRSVAEQLVNGVIDEYDRDSPANEVHLFETDDWVKTFIDAPMLSDPGTVARYCSGGFLAAGRMIERAAGKSLPEFANAVLFEPLGMKRADWKWDFTLDRSQRNEFGQVYLRPRDMLKLGLLIKNRGEWQGRRVISAAWIDAAIAKRSRIDDTDYGLGIWHRWYNVEGSGGARRVDTIMLSGNGGQKVFIVPSLDLLVVSTGSAYFVESPVNEMLAGVLLPGLTRSGAN